MKKSIVAVVLVVFFLFCVGTAVSETIWSDGFESGNFSAWTSMDGNWSTSGGNVYSGSKRAQVNGTGESVLLLQKSTAGYENIVLSYWHRIYNGPENSDFVSVEWTSNSLDWQDLKTYSNVANSPDWFVESFSLPQQAQNNPLFGFRIRSLLDAGSDCVYFDDFLLSGTFVPEPSTMFLAFLATISLLFLRSRKIL